MKSRFSGTPPVWIILMSLVGIETKLTYGFSQPQVSQRTEAAHPKSLAFEILRTTHVRRCDKAHGNHVDSRADHDNVGTGKPGQNRRGAGTLDNLRIARNQCCDGLRSRDINNAHV